MSFERFDSNDHLKARVEGTARRVLAENGRHFCVAVHGDPMLQQYRLIPARLPEPEHTFMNGCL